MGFCSVEQRLSETGTNYAFLSRFSMLYGKRQQPLDSNTKIYGFVMNTIINTVWQPLSSLIKFPFYLPNNL